MNTQPSTAATLIPTDHDDGHTRISPSKIARIILCPASLQMSEDSSIPPEEQNAVAALGSARHAAIEQDWKAVQRAYDTAPATWSDIFDMQATQGAESIVRQAMGAVQDAMRQTDTDVPFRVLTETRVMVSESYGVSGTIDLSWLDDRGAIHVLDYKFGRAPVVATESAQLKSYALGLAQALHMGTLRDPAFGTAHTPMAVADSTRVVLHIVQPAVYAEKADTWATNVYDLTTWWASVVAPALLQAVGPIGRATSHPSLEACKWCRAGAICRARAAFTHTLAASVFDLHIKTLDARLQPPASVLDDDEVFKVYSTLPELESAIEAIKTHVRASLATQSSHGLKLVRARGKRAWRDATSPDLLSKLAEIAALVPHFEYSKSVLLTPPALLKAYPIIHQRYPEIVADHVVKAQGKTLCVVPDTDPRVAISAENPFDGYMDTSDEDE